VNPRSVKALAAVAGGVARKWCIDAQRIYFAGHSDGGTVSTALALMHETRGTARAIAVSAAGMRPSDAGQFGCPQPLPVWLMHGSGDTHFPGWGAEMAAWWAQCNRCTGERGTADADGCAAYNGCAAGAPVVYCEVPMKHTQWPGLQDRMTDFLLSDGRNRNEARQ
jgi:polyhydroxybutyrate depolymerase